ncbi:MAG: hypothetical protein IT373_29535 [Polyangiaceae bacterium]|nr:hypothetical protein [Polyangiaceae bacterium]
MSAPPGPRPEPARRGPGAIVWLLPPVAVALVTGVWAGLVRLGWELPSPGASAVGAHGPLLASGFFGALIAVERAAALAGAAAQGPRWRHAWALGAPLAASVGSLGLALGMPAAVATGLLVGAAVLFTGASLVVLARQRTLFNAVMALGACSWVAGNLVLALPGGTVPAAAPFWVGLLALTIAGERLELMRVRRPPQSAVLALGGLALALVASLGVGAFAAEIGARLTGGALVALAAWMLAFDVARRTIRVPGLTRFTALALLLGHVWLGVAGAVGLVAGALYAGPTYDAALHAAFLGFAFSMVLGHAPIVLPALSGVRLRFRLRAYVPLALLHGSLVLRVLGDATGSAWARAWGGVGNALALAAFIATTALSIERRAPRRA